MKLFRIAAVAAALMLPSCAFAQFPNQNPDPSVAMPAPAGGPVALGQTMAQVDPQGRVAIVQAPSLAPAQPGGVIQLSAFGWLEPYVDTVVQALIVVFFGWLGKSKYTQWLDQSSRDALETFVKNRASSLIADGAVQMRDKSVRVDNPLLYKAANEASTAIPDALKRFSLTPDVVAAKIVDAIPQTQAGAAIIATAHSDDDTAPVPVTDRPPAAPMPPTAPAAS